MDLRGRRIDIDEDGACKRWTSGQDKRARVRAFVITKNILEEVLAFSIFQRV